MTVKDYYIQNYDKRDLFSGEAITYKEPSQYLSTFFVSRTNLINYLTQSKEKENLVRHLLESRKNLKKLEFAPSTVEARSVISLPTPLLCEKIGVDYTKICLGLGLKLKYDYKQLVEFQARPKDFLIHIDGREQSPLNFSINTISNTLDFGDYATNFEPNVKTIFERKSLSDLVSTISQGYDRFLEEIKRAKDMGFYLIVLVERPLGEALKFDELDYMKHTKASPEFIFSRIRKIMQSFDCVQFLFANGRKDCVRLIEKLFLIKGGIENKDLEYFQDKKLL